MVATSDTEIALIESNVKACREKLEKDVAETGQRHEEAKKRLETFQTRVLLQLQVPSKSPQKQRAERQGVIAEMLREGLSPADIATKTGLDETLIALDIESIKKRRRVMGYPEDIPIEKPDEVLEEDPSDVSDLFPADGEAKPKKRSTESESAPEPEPEEENEESDEESEPEEKPKASASPSQSFRAKGGPTPGLGTGLSGPQASRSDLRDEAKKRLREKGVIIFLTTWDKGHRHAVKVDTFGDGKTTPDGLGHGHRFCRFEAIDSIDHKHGLTLDLVNLATEQK